MWDNERRYYDHNIPFYVPFCVQLVSEHGQFIPQQLQLGLRCEIDRMELSRGYTGEFSESRKEMDYSKLPVDGYLTIDTGKLGNWTEV